MLDTVMGVPGVVIVEFLALGDVPGYELSSSAGGGLGISSAGNSDLKPFMTGPPAAPILLPCHVDPGLSGTAAISPLPRPPE